MCNLINTHTHTHTRQLRSQGPVSVHAHRIEGVAGRNNGKKRKGSEAGSEAGAGTKTVTGSEGGKWT